ncbi:response regulator, partial [Mesorhizobium sp. M00.F.Ca.ET.186.01.1.1]
MIRALLVDDEEHALHLLDILLGRMEGVEVVGKSANPLEAVSACKQLKPNVVFLDIEMPKMSGMQLLELLKQEHDELHAVFVTAYNQYAIAAFEQEATDYLLKPIEVQRLNKTVARLQRELSRNAVTATADSSPDQTGKTLLQIKCFGGFDVFNKQQEKLIWRTAKDKEL